jgi:O-antigen/teichoic acid export membrane protein
MLIVLADRVIGILYSSEFTEASLILQIMIVAGFFRVISFSYATCLIARGHFKESIACESVWFISFVLLGIVLIPTVGLIGSAIAVLVAYVLYAALTWRLQIATVGVALHIENKNLMTISLTFILAAMIASKLSFPLNLYGLAALLVIWVALIHEDYRWLARRLLSGPGVK